MHDGIMMYRNRIAAFVKRTWGVDVLMSMHERAARCAEEAIELAQAEGVPLEQIAKIADRVYSRPAGHPMQESSGVGLTWLAWCYARGIDPSYVLEVELVRIENLPINHFRNKHNEKIDAGTSTVAMDSKEGT
jgi:hypothetical protein